MPSGLLHAINGQAGVLKQQTQGMLEEHKSSLVMCMVTAATTCCTLYRDVLILAQTV